MDIILQNKSKLGCVLCQKCLFPLFLCYKRKWNQSSVTPSSKPQLSAGYKFQCREIIARPTVCTVLGEIGWTEAVKLLKNFNKKNISTFDEPGSRSRLHWQKQCSPSVMVSGLVYRRESWDISFQLKFLFIVWRSFRCDWWSPCVSTVCHCKSAGVKYRHRTVFVFLIFFTPTLQHCYSVKAQLRHIETIRYSLDGDCVPWPQLAPPRERPPLSFCSLTNLTSVVLTSASTTVFGTSELKILNTDSSGSSP